MSDEGHEDPAPGPERLREPAAASLRLRAERPRVTRLSRKVLAGGAAIALIAVSRAVLWALQANRTKTAPEELYPGYLTLPLAHRGRISESCCATRTSH